MSSSGGNNDKFEEGTVAVLGDDGESCHPQDEHPQSESPQESVEYIGTIGKEMRKVLPCLSDLTLLRWLGEKVRDPILGFTPSSSSSSSDSRLESCLDPRLPPKLKPNDIVSIYFKYFTSFID